MGRVLSPSIDQVDQPNSPPQQQQHPQETIFCRHNSIQMAFKTFVEVGRAVLITKGPEAGKLGVIGIFSHL